VIPKTGVVKRDRKGHPLLSTTVLTIRRYSGNLLTFLLRVLHLRPEKYREHSRVQLAAALERIQALRNEVLGFDHIAARLNDEGIPSRTGRPWHGFAINPILARR
jgi:hypothetical protein